MFVLFFLLLLAGIIAAIMFLIMLIKAKTTGKDGSRIKKLMLISLGVLLFSFVMMIITVPESDDNSESANSVQISENTSEIDKKKIETTDSLTQSDDNDKNSENEEQLLNDIESLKKELKEKYDVSEPSHFVRGDSTDKWRIVKVANGKAPSEYAVDYAKAYMQDADSTDIHFIVNFSLKTTTKLQIIMGKLAVTTYEYVDKEEHDASLIGGGMILTEDYYDMETGKKITVEADPDAGTVDNDAFVEKVKEVIDDQVGKGEEITNVVFDGKNLTISVDMSNADTSMFSAKDIAEIRISSITDAILALDDKYYNTWDTITLDFGKEGKATFGKNDVKDQGLGRFFDVPIGILN